MRISLCMIVKNEQIHIRQCLESVQGVADEIILADTGSSDETVSIGREFHAKIIQCLWKDDFSEARNLALRSATGDWILWLDADERLSIGDIPQFKALLSQTQVDVLPVRLVNFYGARPADANRSYLSSSYRIFRRKPEITFEGKIHEHLRFRGIVAAESDLILPLQILHYGYMDKEKSQKTDRNLKILLEEYNKYPNDPWLQYHLAVEWLERNAFDMALTMVNRALEGFIHMQQKPPSLTYRLKYQILLQYKAYEAAYRGIQKALYLYSDYVDLHFFKGMLEYHLNKTEKAIESFSHCLTLGEGHPNYLILAGAGSFWPLYFLGQCYQRQEDENSALRCIQKAALLYPEIKENLIEI